MGDAEPETIIEEYDQEQHETDAQATLFKPEPETQPHLTMLQWSRSIGNLVGALAQASQEFDEVKKDSENPFYKSSYADLAALIGATRKQLGKYGLVVLQFPGINSQGKLAMCTFIAHKSNEWILGVLDDIPIARPDIQGVGSGVTYSRRYTYGPALNVAAEEDDDGNRAMATRKEHLASLDEKMRSQERISQVQVKAFIDSCIKTGKTKSDIEQYLDKLNGLRQVEEITKGQWNDAVKWAVTRTEKTANEEKTPLQQDLEKSVDFVKLNRELRAAAAKHDVSNSDIHQYIHEQYNSDHLKDLSAEQLRQTINWIDEQ